MSAERIKQIQKEMFSSTTSSTAQLRSELEEYLPSFEHKNDGGQSPTKRPASRSIQAAAPPEITQLKIVEEFQTKEFD
jgi:hypothetical protein